MNRKLPVLFLILVSGVLSAYNMTLEEAIDYNVSNYPKAQLADLYKSFYQDSFGPGHILADTAASRKYFFYELSDTTVWEGPVYEYTGCGKNFVRLNMDLVRKGIIPAEEYFKAFLSSLGQIEKPDDEAWINEWIKIDSIIGTKNIIFPHEESDRKMINEKVRSRNFTVHHSDAYNSIYKFHYRIISIPEFKKLQSKYNL